MHNQDEPPFYINIYWINAVQMIQIIIYGINGIILQQYKGTIKKIIALYIYINFKHC